MAKSSTSHTFGTIKNNRVLTMDHFSEEGKLDVEKLIKRGKVEIVDGFIRAVKVEASDLTETTTKRAPVVKMDTLVSVGIGSDQYAAKVVRLTACTVTVTYGRNDRTMTFRPRYDNGWWSGNSYYLILGESETDTDPSF